MAKIWIWNSIATRKRSPSDGILENGINILKENAKEKGHGIDIIDWQNSSFYEHLSPRLLIRLNRFFTETIIRLSKKNKKYANLFFPFFSLSQSILSGFQKNRMKKYLNELAEAVVNSKIKIFGVKVWYGESFYWANYLASLIKKKDSSILLIAGGFHVTIYKKYFLENSVFDIAVFAEGEKPLNIILDIVEENIHDWDKSKVLDVINKKIIEKKLKNVIYREDGVIKESERFQTDLSKKSIPNYSEYELNEKFMIHILIDSLGCPWGKCNFCVHSKIYPKFNQRAVKDIINEMNIMLKKGISLFRFAGSETNPNFAEEIADGILKKKLKINYGIGCRAITGLSKSKKLYKKTVKQFEKMINSGLVSLFIGGETANSEINIEIMNKGLVKEDIIWTSKAIHEAEKNTKKKIYFGIAMIYPTPLTNSIQLNDVFSENIQLINEIKPDSVIISPPVSFLDTKWYLEKEKFGFVISEDNETIKKIMEYEYVLFKPLFLWKDLKGVRLAGFKFKEALKECQRFRQEVEKNGYETDLTDEYFMMIKAIGEETKDEIKEFKRKLLADMISCDYSYINNIKRRVNEYSIKLAESNI